MTVISSDVRQVYALKLAALELHGDEMRPSTSMRGRTAACEHRPACIADRAAQGLDGAS